MPEIKISGDNIDMKKTIIAMLMVLVMVLCAVPAFAADGITDAEQAELDHFAAGVEINGKTVTPFDKYINVATDSLMHREYTAEELARVRTCVDECYDILKAENVTCFDDMKNSPRLQEVVDKCTTLANSLGYKLIFNYENGDVVLRTGFNMTATIIVAVALVAVIGAAVIVVSRKRLLAK